MLAADERDVDFGQGIGQRLDAVPRVQHSNRVRTAGLQVDSEPVTLAKCAKKRDVRRRRRIQHPKHEADAVLRHRHLDLRQTGPNRQLADQLAERVD